jgi:hypothetical protein
MGPDYEVLIIEPLFEEANRTRRMIATMARLLTAQYISATIVELPGTGESLIDIADVRIVDWQVAVDAAVAATGATIIASFRGGSLLDGVGLPVWRFAPETGARIVRDLRRVRASGSSETYAGHVLSDAFLGELEAAPLPTPALLRTVRLLSDAAPADSKLEGSPLWRRAEPGEDATLSAMLATDLAHWIDQCAAS